MKLLLESYSEKNILVEKNEKSEKEYFIEGVTLQANIKNNNGRIYPEQLLKESIEKHVGTYFPNRAVGELNHPRINPQDINYENVTHKFVDVKKEGGNFITKAKVCGAKSGIVKNMIDNEIDFGISSRAFGGTKSGGGAKIVQRLHIVSLGDIVHDPSAPDAFMTAVMENKEWVFENGVIVGKDLGDDISDYQRMVNESTKKDLGDTFLKIMQDYFMKLGG